MRPCFEKRQGNGSRPYEGQVVGKIRGALRNTRRGPPGNLPSGYEDGQEMKKTWHADNLEKYRRRVPPFSRFSFKAT